MTSIQARATLLTLALAAFAYNTSESFPVGLLTQMAGGLGVSESLIGALLTVYAAIVAITAIPLVVMTSNVGRRRLVVITVIALAISNLAMAVAPNYEILLAGRLLSATTHGIFWSMIAPTAAMLAPKGREGYAIAMAFAGASLAMVAGTPLVTAMGNLLGWRVSAAALGMVSALAAIGLRAMLPALEVTDTPSGRARWLPFLQLVKSRALLGLCAATIVVVTAYFATYTYISLFVERYTGLSGAGLSIVLFAFGTAGFFGVFAVGRVTDRFPRRAALACVGALAVALLGIGLLGFVSPVGVIASIILLGASFTAVPVCLQAAVLRVAPNAGDVASSIYVVAFQVGIAGGSLAGGVALDSGHLDAIPVIAAIATVFVGVFVARSFIAFPNTKIRRDRALKPLQRV